MAVIITYMDIPSSCVSCVLRFNCAYCGAVHSIDERNNDCPLKSVDDIKAEIQNEISRTIRDEYSQRQNDYCDGIEWAFKYVLEIIDKHCGKENEDESH